VTIPHPIAIVGPTAVGKSAVAERVALRVHGEIIDADSMQVYRGMDVGTAKTPLAERLVPHHCLDLADPGAPYSAALFQRDARAAIESIAARGLAPVVVGGTGLYVRAALDEFSFPEGELTDDTRLALEGRAGRIGAEALHAELVAVDAPSAALIHPNNVRRTIRALEMHATGRSYADQASGFSRREAHYPCTRFIGLTMERALLYARIDARVDAMLAEGLIAEVECLLQAGYRDALTAAQAIGYKELVPVIEGRVPLQTATAEIKHASRRYAKRQLTWFRADPRIVWLDVTGLSTPDATLAVLELLESAEQ
jgi:tRNA dimethylallyltransferase